MKKTGVILAKFCTEDHVMAHPVSPISHRLNVSRIGPMIVIYKLSNLVIIEETL